MRRSPQPSRGFTFVELAISLAVIVILGSIGITAFYNSRNSKDLDTIADGIGFTLEQAKADSIGGKGASGFGVFVASSSYSYFKGSSYSASDPSNLTTNIPGGWVLNATTSNHMLAVAFKHMTGAAVATGTIQVSNLKDPTLSRTISIGSAGDITVIR